MTKKQSFFLIFLLGFSLSCSFVTILFTPSGNPTSTTSPTSTPTPEPSPALELLDDFEYPHPQLFSTTEGSGSVVLCEYDDNRAQSGDYSLSINYDVIPGGFAACMRLYLSNGVYGDFGDADGISFWYRASESNQLIAFYIHIGDPGTPYSVVFNTTPASTQQWVQQSFMFDEFTLAPWMTDAQDPFDLSRVNSYGFEPAMSGENVSLTLWIDDVYLISN